MTWLELVSICRSLRTDPNDSLANHTLADWYEEQGKMNRALAHRWLATGKAKIQEDYRLRRGQYGRWDLLIDHRPIFIIGNEVNTRSLKWNTTESEIRYTKALEAFIGYRCCSDKYQRVPVLKLYEETNATLSIVPVAPE